MPNVRVIPFGDRIMVRRRKVGEKAGNFILPDEVKDRPTDLADVMAVPDLTFSDQEILKNAEHIVDGLVEKASNGDADAVGMLLRMNEFIRFKSIKPGDAVMVGRYTGTDFVAKGDTQTQTLVRVDDIIGLVVDDE